MNSQIEFSRKVVYFEKQSNDRLCGNHCLNSLLQAPVFNPFSLAEIAQKLDELERNLYAEDNGGFNANINGNVDDDGNYNVQVLSEALKVYGAEIVPVRQSECDKLLSESLDHIEAFIFNSSTHWFAIRKICNIWFNLNSTNPGPGPQIISDFYLSAFIKGTEELGYTNFLVNNIPPLFDLGSEYYKNLQPFQKLVPIEEILQYKPKKINMGDTDDQAMERAIELSKKEYEKVNPLFEQDFQNVNDFSDYFPLDNGIKDHERNLIEQNELKEVLEMSMNEYVIDLQKLLPKEPDTNVPHLEINFQPENKGIAFSRRFNPEDKIADLKTFAKTKLRTYGDIRLMGSDHHNKIYVDENLKLKEAGLNDKETLVAQLIE